MTRRRTDLAVALVALAVLGYSLMIQQSLLLGIIITATISISYMLWRRGESEYATVLLVFFGLTAAAAVTDRLEIVVPAVIVAMLGYLVWNVVVIRREISDN